MTMPVAIHLAPERIMSRFERPHVVSAGGLPSLRSTRARRSPLEIACARLDIPVASPAFVMLSPAAAADRPGDPAGFA